MTLLVDLWRNRPLGLKSRITFTKRWLPKWKCWRCEGCRGLLSVWHWRFWQNFPRLGGWQRGFTGHPSYCKRSNAIEHLSGLAIAERPTLHVQSKKKPHLTISHFPQIIRICEKNREVWFNKKPCYILKTKNKTWWYRIRVDEEGTGGWALEADGSPSH